MRLGSAEQRAAFLPELDGLDRVGVFAMTESAAGSNVAATATRARFVPDRRGFLLTSPDAGAAKFMPNLAASGVPKLALILARVGVESGEEALLPVVVRSDGPGSTPGVAITPAPESAFLGMDNATTSFTEVWVPYDQLLHGGMVRLADDGSLRSALPPGRLMSESLRTVLAAMPGGRAGLSAAALAMAQAGLSITLRYAVRRRLPAVGGDVTPMIGYRPVQRDLFTALARVWAGQFLMNQVRRTLADPYATPETVMLAATTAKPLVTNAALRTLQVCRERLGARGMLDVNRISRYVGFVNGAITAEGENQVIALAAGRWIAAGRGYEPPADAGDATATSLDDPALWKRLATTRETQAIRRLRQTLDDERLTDPFARWNAATVPALDVVDAYTHRLCVEAYLQAITEPVTDPDRALLRSLALLYVLDDVRTHAAEYASRGLLTPTQLATLGAQADDAYAALTPHTEHLADAYAIDAERLAVP